MIIIAPLFWLAWCIVVAVVAGSRNREPALWLLAALVISPLLATIALALMPIGPSPDTARQRESAAANAATAAFLAPPSPRPSVFHDSLWDCPPHRFRPQPAYVRHRDISTWQWALAIAAVLIALLLLAWSVMPQAVSSRAEATMRVAPRVDQLVRPLILTPPGVEPDPLADPRLHLVPL